MILAAIDIGTNALRLFISRAYHRNGQIVVDKLTLVRVPVRLGMDVFTHKVLPDELVDRLIKSLKAFSLLIDVYNPVAWRACATSAMREASNKEKVIQRIYRETNLTVEIIDGLKEASLLSTFSDLRFPVNSKYKLFVDVGGGSTEISLVRGREVKRARSFKIGTVRLLSEQVDKASWDDMKQWLSERRKESRDMLLVGSGGNINKLMKMYGNESDKMLDADQLLFGVRQLQQHSLEERIMKLGLRPDRADVIIPAAEIFRFILKHTGANQIYVPKIGLSDGIVHDLFARHSTTK